METIAKIRRKTICMEENSEKLIPCILVLLKSSGKSNIYISSWRNNDTHCLDSTFKCRIIWKILEVNLIKPCSSNTSGLILEEGNSIKSIFFISCYFSKLVESRADIESCRKSLSFELFDHVRAYDWICEKIHHKWTFCL